MIPEDKRWLSNFCLPDLENYYSDIKRDIWNLTRKTYTTGQILACSYRPIGDERIMEIDMENLKFLPSYSKKDVSELAFKMAGYLENISAEIPGATTAYDNFIQETRNAECIYSEVCLFPFHGKYCVVNW